MVFKYLRNLASSKIVGIDLGTTNSVICVLKEGKPFTILNKEGKPTTPSVVGYSKDGTVLVGASALRASVTNPTKTFFSAKRFIGTVFTSKPVQQAAFSVPYVVRPDKQQEDKTAFELDGRLIYPEQISAEVLKYLKECAEDYLGHEVTEAVITCPAYFDERQRQATKAAGEIAGLTVRRILNEPTAAALAYGLEMKEGAKRIAVFDLGGGTYDFSICDIDDDGEKITVLATGGDSHLGGDNFDECLMTSAITKFQTDHGLDLTKYPEALARLKVAMHDCKLELSSTKQSTVNLPFLVVGPAGPLHFQLDVTREQFEKMIEPILKRTLSPIDDVLQKAGMKPSDLDDLILVGGSTRIPLVQSMLEKHFGKVPNKSVNLDEAVAHGACIQAAILKDKIKRLELIDIVGHDLGVECQGDQMSVIIPAGSRLPISIRKPYTTVTADQNEVEVICRQGGSKRASENTQLGTFTLVDIPPMPAGVPRINVTYTLDSDGILTVIGEDEKGRNQRIVVKDTSLSKDEIEHVQEELDLDPQVRKELNTNREALSKAIKEAEDKIDDLDDKKKGKLAVLIEEGKRSIEGELKPKLLLNATKKIAEFIDKN
jgi:molecular chaperone DnaK